MDATTELTREALVSLCERAVVPVEKWRNRDSAGAQDGIGRAWALLKAGRDFHIRPRAPEGSRNGCFTDDRTIWIDVEWPGFQAFEYGRSERHYWDDDMFYIPTDARLAEANGDDWY